MLSLQIDTNFAADAPTPSLMPRSKVVGVVAPSQGLKGMLDRLGAEDTRATGIVRYATGGARA